MIIDNFAINQEQLDRLLSHHPNTGKNSDVGSIAVKIVEMYFKNRYPDATFLKGSKGADMEVNYQGKIERFEVKGTVDPSIAWQKLKVSSQDCYECLLEGMTLIRVTSIGALKMKLHFMKYGEDFILEPEVRFAVKPVRNSKSTK
ncbi:MAG TPA: hypothetical protein VFE32_19305 [Puia sp.]|jgi:hypothetical protein|nr:hypothetical protein [Puia sp.]